MSNTRPDHKELLSLTTEIVASHVSNNSVPVGDIGKLIEQIYTTLASVGQVAEEIEEKREPAVSAKKSITPTYLICLEDGKKLKMLKRHLKTRYNLTPEQYRERWNLPADYPMVAPNYAEQRRRLAMKIGLGTNRARAK
jgi:predicted transcriptional regulator